MKSIKSLLLISIVLTSFGCGDSYTLETTELGLRYHFFEQNPNAKKGQIKDIYSLNVSIENVQKEVLMKEFLMFERYQSVYPGDFHEGLAMLAIGDSAVFELNADSFFFHHGMDKPQTIVDTNEMIRVYVRATQIQSPFEHLIDMSEKEVVMMDKFVKRKNWNVVIDSTGIQYEITIHNEEGQQVKLGDRVKLSYLYYTLSEKIIQKSKENDYWEFVVGDPTRISGLSRILPFMKEDERIRAILPFTEAFGPEGMGILIPPYTTIVIELEVHEIMEND